MGTNDIEVPADGERAGGKRSSDPRVSRAWLKQVQHALTERGWTQRRLASEANINESNVSRLFKREAGKETVTKVASVLGLMDPLAAPDEDEDEIRLEWVTLGMRMRSLEPAKFSSIIEALRAWDTAANKWALMAGVVSGIRDVEHGIHAERGDRTRGKGVARGTGGEP